MNFATIATAVVTLLTSILNFLPSASSSQVGSFIVTLTQLIPIVVQEATDLIAPIKNIIAALGQNPAATADQLAALATLDAQCDAAFETAATNAGLPPDSGS